MASYLSTTPPPSIGPLQDFVNAQQSQFQSSNAAWLRDKSQKLHNKCEALKKACTIVSSSLTKMLEKRHDLLKLWDSFDEFTPSATRSKCEAAAFALEGAMLKERDGSEAAPRKKSLDARLKDVDDTRCASCCVVIARNFWNDAGIK